MAPGRGGQAARDDAAERAASEQIDGIVKHVNGQLAAHQRLAAWRMWPEPDFPRTHSLKVKRNEVRDWAEADIPLAVRDPEALVKVGLLQIQRIHLVPFA